MRVSWEAEKDKLRICGSRDIHWNRKWQIEIRIIYGVMELIQISENVFEHIYMADY